MPTADNATRVFIDRTEERNNCIDFLRFLLASLVIYSHSTAMNVGDNRHDPIFKFTQGQITLGDAAVEGFFILSGFLVLQSWEHSRGLFDYFKKRVLRIYPAFLCVAFVCAIVVGPLATPSVSHYVAALHPYRLLGRTLLLQEIELPLVFLGNPLQGWANAPTWTVGWEGFCYLVVPLLGILGVYHRRWLLTLLLALLVAAYLKLQYGDYFSLARSVELFGGPKYKVLRLTAFFSSE